MDYVPSVFPGFSWHNLNLTAKFDTITRNRGQFYWNQLQHAIKSGSEMIYVAMYDEVNEGTAIIKVSKDPLAGKARSLILKMGFHLTITYTSRVTQVKCSEKKFLLVSIFPCQKKY